MFNDQRRSILSMLVGLAVIGLFAGFAFGADSTSAGLRAYDVTLTPNFITADDDRSSNYQAVWLYAKSPTTPYVSPDSYAHQGRYLLLDPRATDSSGRPGQDDWWFVIQRYWPATYQPSNHGNWGREENFHNVAGDAGPDGGIGWSFGSGVSALALDWLPGQSSPQFTVEPNHPNENLSLPPVSRDAWHTYVVHFVAGRTDQTTVHPGSLTVWADGSDSPTINLSNINTIQRAQGPDGNWYVQRWMQLWEGDYTQALSTQSTVRLTLTRIGNSLQQALADRPVIDSTNVARQFYSGSGANLGAPSVTSVGALTANDGAIPTALGGSGGSPAAPSSGSSTTTTYQPGSPPAAPSSGSSTTTAKQPGTPSAARHTQSVAIPRSRSADDTSRLSAAAEAAAFWWDGSRFDSWTSLKSHLVARGVDPNGFLRSHPTIATKLSMRSIEWDSKQFFVRGALASWLHGRGQNYQDWANRHSQAATKLTS